ncbi:aldo/keto reductase [Yoonia maritima]|uniref:aldo/keto reductase n=1 Tax=Yoonia maritima TaxID=1435347 RepID=UPI0013A60D3C|nr:aldo/keto reductase [Yoonia maritima]
MHKALLEEIMKDTLPLGMGCASLGSRISPNRGQTALALAYDNGVRWFDVAPAYGAGEAEKILGHFLKGKRHQAFICTKVGLAPPARNGVVKLAYSLARPAAAMAKGLRKQFRKSRATRNVHVALSPELLVTSLDQSLAALGTDYVDVFALHDPAPEDTRRDDICDVLMRLKEQGKVRALSIAGSYNACRHGLTAPMPPFSFAQLADPPGSGGVVHKLAHEVNRPFDTVVHSVLGVGGACELLTNGINANPQLRHAINAIGIEGSASDMAAKTLLRRAFSLNPHSIVLMSMFSQKHLASNLEAVQAPPLSRDILQLIESTCNIGSGR